MNAHDPPPLGQSRDVPKDETLSQRFNRHAKAQQQQHQPVATYKQKIARLRSMLSAPKPERHLTPRYADANRPRTLRDQRIAKHIATIQKTVQAQRTKIKQDFAKASLKSTAKRSFNRAARRK